MGIWLCLRSENDCCLCLQNQKGLRSAFNLARFFYPLPKISLYPLDRCCDGRPKLPIITSPWILTSTLIRSFDDGPMILPQRPQIFRDCQTCTLDNGDMESITKASAIVIRNMLLKFKEDAGWLATEIERLEATTEAVKAKKEVGSHSPGRSEVAER